jgi:bacillithiol biosynthesis cysteine-adding enzyme BshC
MSIDVAPRELELTPLARQAFMPERSLPWYPPWPAGDGWKRRADATRATFTSDWLEPLLPALQPAGVAAERLRRAAREGVVVTTGQQPGLFGGPLYTWYKALTVLALADELERRTGYPVAPVFWAATDDSDIVEATVTTVAVPGGAEVIELSASALRDTPVSAVPLGDATAAFDRLSAACGSAASADILRRVRAAYSPDATLGGAYVQLLRECFHPLGITVLDAAHPATRAAAAPLLTAALRRANIVAERLQERSREIQEQNWRPQVRDMGGRTLVFEMNGERRRRIRIGEATQIAETAAASELSPNVLLRPLAERAILPTVAYVGGPAEVAYFAQVSAVADALEVEQPLIVPRWSGFILEPHVQSTLDELGVTIEDLRDPHLLEGQLARAELPERVRAILSDSGARFGELPPALLEAARSENLDLSAGVVVGAAGQLLHKLDRLERRLIAAVKRRGSERLRALATARGSLFPRDVPQERALNMIPLLARYGNEPLDKVLAAARAHVSAF